MSGISLSEGEVCFAGKLFRYEFLKKIERKGTQRALTFIIIKKDIILNKKYKVIDFLAQGGMSRVYLTEDLEIGSKVVVKERLFSDDTGLDLYTLHEIFFREAEIMCHFDHSGLPKVYEVFRENNNAYLVMEYIKGNTLEEVMNSLEGPVEIEKAVRWTIELADIIYYLHNSFDKPLVYRDLKPSNIIVTEEDKLKLIDFGTVRYYNPNKEKDTDTFRLGSPGYAPPEQYEGGGQTTPRTDVFSLGVILYQMLTKYDPTVTPLEFAPMNVLNPFVTQELEDIINHAIELNPSKRFNSAKDFKRELERYLGIKPSSDTSSVKLFEPSKKSDKINSYIGATFYYFTSAALLILLVLTLFFSFLSPEKFLFFSFISLIPLHLSSLPGLIFSVKDLCRRRKEETSCKPEIWGIIINSLLYLIVISFSVIIFKKLF